jgi:DNA-binding winged helix-turn-helix (wHTH) protein/tetratricopeptide (TPR) repeat protein
MSEPSTRHYTFGPFQLVSDQHLLTRDGESIALPPKGFDLLCLLVSEGGRLFEKNRLMQTLWPDTFVEEANLSNLVALLRRALGDSPTSAKYIRTVPKLGYRFVAPISSPAPETQENQTSGSAAPRRAIRILVFPFRYDKSASNLEYLAYSLPEAISTTLAELNVFTIRSIQVAMRYDLVHWDPRQVGKDEDVDVILGGSLNQHRETSIHAVTHLIDAAQGTLLWSKSWEVDETDLFRFHQAVVHLLVRSLVRGGGGEDWSFGVQFDKPSNPETYELYLRANQLTSFGADLAKVALARDLYIACTEKDPHFAPAWARLGRCYRLLEKFQPGSPVDGRLALGAIERAFALNANSAIAHNVCTPIQADMGQAESAMVRLLRRAASHDSDPEVFTGLVQACRYCGQLDASLEAHRIAIALDPNARTSVAHTYFAMADYEKAIYWYGRGFGLYMDVLALASMGREQEASAMLWTRKVNFAAMPSQMNSLDAYLQKDPKRGVAVLQTASQIQFRDPESRFYLARQAARLGAVDLANALMLQSVEEGCWSTVRMARDPWLETLRGTASFAHTCEIVKAREAQSTRAFLRAGGARILSRQSFPSKMPAKI